MKRVKFNNANDDRLFLREKLVLKILEETPGLRTNEQSSMIEVNIPPLFRTFRTLKNLINLGLIEYRGSKRLEGII